MTLISLLLKCFWKGLIILYDVDSSFNELYQGGWGICQFTGIFWMISRSGMRPLKRTDLGYLGWFCSRSVISVWQNTHTDEQAMQGKNFGLDCKLLISPGVQKAVNQLFVNLSLKKKTTLKFPNTFGEAFCSLFLDKNGMWGIKKSRWNCWNTTENPWDEIILKTRN